MSTLPTKTEVLAWIRENPGHASKRDVARAFGLKGADKIALKAILRELEDDGDLRRDRKQLREAGALPPVTVLRVTGIDRDGDLWAAPAEWDDASGREPRVLLRMREHEPALAEGDRILARITAAEDEGAAYTGRLIRRIGRAERKIVGIFRETAEGGRVLSVDRKSGHEWRVAQGERHGARDGELVEAEQSGPRDRLGLPRARITRRLGDPTAPRAVSLIAIETHGLPLEFPDGAREEAEAARPIESPGNRRDLRDLPLVTIDPPDARDRDDAVCALPDPDREGGHIVWVAIADVAAYVRPDSALDREARNRGNSTYFPDRVVPMLPEELSADLCSLHAEVDRACVAVEMHFDADGNRLSHRFHRGLMRSAAALNYKQVQTAIDGQPDAMTEGLLEPVLRPLWAAYEAMSRARDRRAPLHIELPERRIELAEDGTVTSVAFRERLEAHKLIEEFMIAANVCAAETLERKRTPLVYRVHEEPEAEKMDALRETAEASGLTFPKGQVLTTRSLNRLLDQAAGGETAELINLTVLRSMPQAYYAVQNFGHFGLALRAYAHFTSPIRRYADLVVHRALISAHGWGDDGLKPAEIDRLEATAEWISQTERRSMQAERDTTDRYLAAYLAERVGEAFEGRVSGVARFGLFVRIDETGADGLIPIGTLGDEYYHFDRDSQTLMGDRSGLEIGLGDRVVVRLAEAEAITGGLVFELLELAGTSIARGPRRATGRGAPKRKLAREKIKRGKIARKIKRRRST